LRQEQSLSKFANPVATASTKNIALPLAHLLEDVLIFKPQLDAIVTHQGQMVFREDWHYYQECDDGAILPYDPFTMGNKVEGVVRCQEDTGLCLHKDFLDSIWHSLDYAQVTNPLLSVMVADFLGMKLNEEQEWVAHYAKLPTHFMQNYVNLEKLILARAPELMPGYQNLAADVLAAREDFALEVARQKGTNYIFLSKQEIEKMYNARGRQYEDIAIQDFWERPEVQEVLNDLQIAVGRVISGLFPTIRAVAERSLMPAFGYDVFLVTTSGTRINVSNLGDYRVLHWELNK
jgi:hypothetical protein